jgi:phage tail-like protein
MNEYPPSAFYFKLEFSSPYGKGDTSFQEVSGIGAEIVTEEVAEGGENWYVYQVPKSIKYPRLVLKRGIAPKDSPLVMWCKSLLENGFPAPVDYRSIKVFLMNEKKEPTGAWTFENAYPVKWNIDPFNSTKNEVAIETIELVYTYSERLI